VLTHSTYLWECKTSFFANVSQSFRAEFSLKSDSAYSKDVGVAMGNSLWQTKVSSSFTPRSAHLRVEPKEVTGESRGEIGEVLVTSQHVPTLMHVRRVATTTSHYYVTTRVLLFFFGVSHQQKNSTPRSEKTPTNIVRGGKNCGNSDKRGWSLDQVAATWEIWQKGMVARLVAPQSEKLECGKGGRGDTCTVSTNSPYN